MYPIRAVITNQETLRQMFSSLKKIVRMNKNNKNSTDVEQHHKIFYFKNSNSNIP